MPLTVIKKPEWGLFYYYIQGYCTSAELLKAAEEVTQEPLERAVTIFDLLKGDLDMEQQDIMQIIKINKRLYKNGKITTHAAILTNSRTLEIFIKAFELLSSDEQTKLQTFPSLEQGLIWLGLDEHKVEIQEILNNIQK